MPEGHEQRGRRSKQWVTDSDGREWLRKEPRESRPAEPAIEVFTLELAARCGLPIAPARLATWSGGFRGIVSPSFVDKAAGEESRDGSVLLEAGLDRYERATPQARVMATLDAVFGALAAYEARHAANLRLDLLRILMFDAWIGNGDRHADNWTVIEHVAQGRTLVRLAPMFDTAGCLGAELLEEHVPREHARVSSYVARCPSGFGDGETRPGIALRDVTTTILRWPGAEAEMRELLPQFERLTREVELMLANLGDTWLSPNRKKFAARVLEARVKLLQELLP